MAIALITGTTVAGYLVVRADHTNVGAAFADLLDAFRGDAVAQLVIASSAYITLALAIADHGYVMENGRIVLDGSADQLRDNADIKEFYLGLTEVGARKSYRDVKHYKRRKRWLS